MRSPRLLSPLAIFDDSLGLALDAGDLRRELGMRPFCAFHGIPYLGVCAAVVHGVELRHGRDEVGRGFQMHTLRVFGGLVGGESRKRPSMLRKEPPRVRTRGARAKLFLRNRFPTRIFYWKPLVNGTGRGAPSADRLGTLLSATPRFLSGARASAGRSEGGGSPPSRRRRTGLFYQPSCGLSLCGSL